MTTFAAFAELNKSHAEDPDQHWFLILGVYEDIGFPVSFKQYNNGKKMLDMLETGWQSLHLISDRFKEELEKNNLTGWKTYPIKLMTKKNEEIKGYHGLSISGRCGPIDYSKAEIVEKRLVPNGILSKYYKGEYIGLEKWDGSDFFLSEQNFGIFVSAKATEILKKAKITNIIFRNLPDIEIDEFTVEVAKKNANKNQKYFDKERSLTG